MSITGRPKVRKCAKPRPGRGSGPALVERDLECVTEAVAGEVIRGHDDPVPAAGKHLPALATVPCVAERAGPVADAGMVDAPAVGVVDVDRRPCRLTHPLLDAQGVPI